MLSNFLSFFLDPTFLESQHGFRPGLGTLSAWKYFFQNRINEAPWIWEFDLRKFFDSANMNYVNQRLKLRLVPEGIANYISEICIAAPHNPESCTLLLGRDEYGKKKEQPSTSKERRTKVSNLLFRLSTPYANAVFPPLKATDYMGMLPKRKFESEVKDDFNTDEFTQEEDMLISGRESWLKKKYGKIPQNKNIKEKEFLYWQYAMAGNLNNLNKKETIEKKSDKKDFTFTDFTGTNLWKSHKLLKDYDKTPLRALTKLSSELYLNESPRINPHFSGTPQGNPLSPTLALVGIQEFLSQPLKPAHPQTQPLFGWSLSYADDGIFFGTSKFKVFDDPSLGVRISSDKSGWIKEDGIWKKDFKFLGLTLTKDGIWKASTRNGSDLELGRDIKVIMRRIEELEKEGYSADLSKESPGVMNSFKKIFESQIIGLVQNRLYQGSWNLTNMEQDFKLKFKDNSWTKYNKHALPASVSVFNISTFASRSLCNMFRIESRIRSSNLNKKIKLCYIGPMESKSKESQNDSWQTMFQKEQFLTDHRFPNMAPVSSVI